MDPWKVWRERLHSPRYVLAPMVDHSELPWRALSRDYGCDMAYTPMFHAANFATSKKYRQKYFSTCDADKPLIVQFCANKADILVNAASYVKDSCDGIDINLGCPQEIARRGHYGAFLQEEWELIDEMVTKLRNSIDSNHAVSCKIRRFDELSKTCDYAKMLEKAGCSFIAVHGRTREQRGCKTGLAEWSYIKAVKSSVQIPVIANGNIQSRDDAEDCLNYTGCDAIMTAEGNLYNPALFYQKHECTWEVAFKYLNYVEKYPIPLGMVKSHLFKIFHKCIAIDDNADLRSRLGSSSSIDQLINVVEMFKSKYFVPGETQSMAIQNLPVPPYLTQARFRYLSQEANVIEPLSAIESPIRKKIKIDFST